MDLMDRYLGAIRRNLPARKADDIIAELKDVLLSLQEEKEAALGRPLNRAEQEAMLKEFGHPLLVAARYGRQQYLIGPEVFPFYVYVLRTVLVIVAGVLVTLGIADIFMSGGDPNQVIARTFSTLWDASLVIVGLITIIFFALERYGFPAQHLKAWRPSQLPRIAKDHSRFELVSELTANAIFVLWWVGVIHFPDYIPGNAPGALHAHLAPIFRELYWPVLGGVGLRMLQQLINLAWSNLIWLRAAATVIATTVNLAVLALLYQAGRWVVLTGADVPPEALAHAQYGVDLGMRIGFGMTAVIWTLQAGRELLRLSRAGR